MKKNTKIFKETLKGIKKYQIYCNEDFLVAAFEHEENRDNCLNYLCDTYPNAEFTKVTRNK